FGGGRWYMRDSKDHAEVVAQLDQLRRLPARYDTLVGFYDLSALEANRRDGLRPTDKQPRQPLEQAKALACVVLVPGVRLVPELLRESPWGDQPLGENQHHGATWPVDLTARTLAAMLYPTPRGFLRDRIPARLRARPAEQFGDDRPLDPLRRALDAIALDPSKLAVVAPGYVQVEFVDGQLQVYVDLAGFSQTTETDLDAVAVAVLDKVLREDVHADFAETVLLELVEFGNYDEYGNGLLESAQSKWKRELDRRGLEQFLRAHQPR